MESKRELLKEAASATGQKSLQTFFEKSFGISRVSATETERVQKPLLSEKESNVVDGGDGNDLAVDSQIPQATYFNENSNKLLV
jgi:hypothetical protein